jgi:YfiH family protein
VSGTAVVRFGTVADGDMSIDAEPEALAARRSAICPLPWTWLRQVHGGEAIVVDQPGALAGAEADAMVTARPGAVLSIQTADCAPVLFVGDGGVIGAAHAGWRGLAAGVLEATVAAMESLGAGAVSARLGPCISPAAYEFGPAELTTLALQFGPNIVGATTDGRPALDLRAAVRQVMADLGVSVDESAVACTALDPGWFSWRARRDTARQCSIVWIEP